MSRRARGRRSRGGTTFFACPDGALLDVTCLRERVRERTPARAGPRRRTLYRTRCSFASNALAAGEGRARAARMPGRESVKVLLDVYTRYIPNRTRQDGSALAGRSGADTGAAWSLDTGKMQAAVSRPASSGSRIQETERVGAEGGI